MSNFPTGGHVSPGKAEIVILEPPKGKQHLVWMGRKKEGYDKVLQNWSNHLDSIGVDESVTREYRIGQISENLAAQLLNSLKSIPRVEFNKFDCNIDYVASSMKNTEVPLWARFLKFFNFEEEQLALVKLICEELKPTIENYLGTSFRIINVKSFETLPGSYYFGPNKRHRDSLYPTHTYKVFVYLTPPNIMDGTTYIYPTADNKDKISISGPAGTYLLFNPVITSHSGHPPEKNRRAMLEIILVPSHKTEINPTFNGTNSTIPIEVYNA